MHFYITAKPLDALCCLLEISPLNLWLHCSCMYVPVFLFDLFLFSLCEKVHVVKCSCFIKMLYFNWSVVQVLMTHVHSGKIFTQQILKKPLASLFLQEGALTPTSCVARETLKGYKLPHFHSILLSIQWFLQLLLIYFCMGNSCSRFMLQWVKMQTEQSSLLHYEELLQLFAALHKTCRCILVVIS